MKRLAVLITVLCTGIVPVYAESAINIKINGEDFKTDTQPTVINDRVMVPMREIFEKFNARVEWEDSTKTINAVTESNSITLQIGNRLMIMPDETVELDAAPVIENDRTLVPARAVAESFGAKVEWDAQTRTVYIVNDNEKETVFVSIEMEDGGIMKAELYPEIAPVTVENFVKLANEGFYDGLIFHRVIEDFMIQGGGYDEDFNEKDAESIVGEFSSNGFENKLKHTRGVLSMARTIFPDSASSQFFIMHNDAPYLDGQYAAFGKLTEGFEVLDRIAAQETETIGNGMADVPVKPQIIKTIRIEDGEL